MALSKEDKVPNERYNLYVKVGTLTTANTTATKLFDLPQYAIPHSVRCYTKATSTGATLTVGDAATAAKYVSAGDVSAAQVNEMTLLNAAQITGAPKPIYGSIGGSPSSGGPFEVRMEYYAPKSTRVI